MVQHFDKVRLFQVQEMLNITIDTFKTVAMEPLSHQKHKCLSSVYVCSSTSPSSFLSLHTGGLLQKEDCS